MWPTMAMAMHRLSCASAPHRPVRNSLARDLDRKRFVLRQGILFWILSMDPFEGFLNDFNGSFGDVFRERRICTLPNGRFHPKMILFDLYILFWEYGLLESTGYCGCNSTCFSSEAMSFWTQSQFLLSKL